MTLEMREREIGRREYARGEAAGEKRGQKRGEALGQRRGEEIGQRRGEEAAKGQAFLNALKNGVDPKLAQKIVSISDETAERLLKSFLSTEQNS